MTQFETLTLSIAAAQVLVSVGAVAAIIAGITQMRRAGDQRAAREDARHAEAMEALRALIERTDRTG